MNNLTNLKKFAKRYAEAWCSQNPQSVAEFFAANGSLNVNDGPPPSGRMCYPEQSAKQAAAAELRFALKRRSGWS